MGISWPRDPEKAVAVKLDDSGISPLQSLWVTRESDPGDSEHLDVLVGWLLVSGDKLRIRRGGTPLYTPLFSHPTKSWVCTSQSVFYRPNKRERLVETAIAICVVSVIFIL